MNPYSNVNPFNPMASQMASQAGGGERTRNGERERERVEIWGREKRRRRESTGGTRTCGSGSGRRGRRGITDPEMLDFWRLVVLLVFGVLLFRAVIRNKTKIQTKYV